MINLPNDIIKQLGKFYKKLELELLKQKKKKSESILLSFLKLKSNVRFNLLNEARIQIDSFNIKDDELEKLTQENLISNADDYEYYEITAKGIWVYEKYLSIISEDNLIEFINQEYFKNEVSVSLNDKEKVILLLFISARAFSEEIFIDLKKSETTNDKLKIIAEDCFNFLNKCGLIKKLNLDDLFGKQGNEHPVSNLIRHTDKLPKKTKGIYKALYNQRYCLNLFKDNEIFVKGLSFLFWLIFGNTMSEETKISLIQFCANINNEYSTFLYDSGVEDFSSPKYDEDFENAIMDYERLNDKFY